jgi:DnaK suppressor protein
VGNLSNDSVEDRAERGTDNECAETTISLAENASARLREITAALERINEGTFGSCEVCSQEISTSRLQAAPFARQCIECARKAQKGKPASPGNL